MHYNCLIVDDEIELAKMTCEYFQMFDTSCACVAGAGECLAFLKENTVDILLLDINLCEESGFDLCKKIREERDFPILFISARQSDDDILIALSIGGDDYIKKPYTLSVLLAKVKVMLKRMKGKTEETASTGGKYQCGRLRLEEATLRAFVGEREVQLKAKEFSLLQCLFENRNTIVTKEKLFDRVWGDAWYSDGTLNVHIRKLREKLEDNPNEPKLIKTIWGTGYMLEIH
ncbi:MAG: response regulator transcription factor [Lachnospiraceae bacterium]